MIHFSKDNTHKPSGAPIEEGDWLLDSDHRSIVEVYDHYRLRYTNYNLVVPARQECIDDVIDGTPIPMWSRTDSTITVKQVTDLADRIAASLVERYGELLVKLPLNGCYVGYRTDEGRIVVVDRDGQWFGSEGVTTVDMAEWLADNLTDIIRLAEEGQTELKRIWEKLDFTLALKQAIG